MKRNTLKIALAVAAAPFVLVAGWLASAFLPLLCGGRDECVADGIVPASRRHDFDFRAEVEKQATRKDA